jgi:hypothetical protein
LPDNTFVGVEPTPKRPHINNVRMPNGSYNSSSAPITGTGSINVTGP